MDCFTQGPFIPTNKNIIPIPGLTTFVAKTADASALQVAVKRYPTYDAIMQLPHLNKCECWKFWTCNFQIY